MIYTTYFGNLRNLPSHIRPIAICRFTPPNLDIPHYPDLAPNEVAFYEGKHGDPKRFEELFNNQLSQLNPDVVVEELYDLVPDEVDEVALVCYEKPNEVCHRHFIAKWLRDEGYPVKEWGEENQ